MKRQMQFLKYIILTIVRKKKMFGGEATYDQQIGTGKRISGFQSLPYFIQPEKNHRSVWAGIRPIR